MLLLAGSVLAHRTVRMQTTSILTLSFAAGCGIAGSLRCVPLERYSCGLLDLVHPDLPTRGFGGLEGDVRVPLLSRRVAVSPGTRALTVLSDAVHGMKGGISIPPRLGISAALKHTCLDARLPRNLTTILALWRPQATTGSVVNGRYLVDPASSHMLVSKIKPCMCKYELIQTVKLRMAH